ncbi:MAG: cytochrome B6 [Acidobacteriota bacterium]|nr:cytochrome B6 [Acidobacteriota bacterium]
MMKPALWTTSLAAIVLTCGLTIIAQEPERNRNAADDPVAKFQETVKKMSAEKPAHMAAARAHLAERYDLSNRPAPGVTMTRGKAVQDGVRVKLPSGITWQQLAALTPDEIRRRNVWPLGFLPLPHVHHPEGGMLFPQAHIDEVKRQTDRDLARFDLDFETPDIFIPEFPPAIFLTTRPDLGDVSKGKLITSENFNDVLAGLLNPKQLEGLRLLVMPFPQQQFNGTEDRRSVRPSLGVTCFDCHVNGHTNAASHLVGDIRPQEFRHRIETPTLRGVNVQRLFGSQRALKSVEDFTEFEQRAAYFDGDPVMATKKGVNILERASQVHFMSEMESIFDFPPAPKLGVDGKLDPAKATPAEMRGQGLFFGKAQCSSCHPAPYYTDNQMHDLQTGRFFEPRTIRNHTMVTDGKIKTFPLRGIKESPPYLHDGRLMTLDDTVEFFNIILGTKLTDQEKKDLVVFMRAL